MFRYIKRIDRQINDTLNVYTELGKMSMPFFKYVLLIISFLIATSCISIIFSFFTESETELNSNTLWTNYSLPIIMYGVLCPFVSTIISSVLRLFIESQIHNIKNKNNYIYKKSGKKPGFCSELGNIAFYVIYSRYIFIIPISSILLWLPLSKIINYMLIIMLDVFVILYKVSKYYDNYIECDMIGVEKCHTPSEMYYRYCMEVQYPNEEKKIIKKRFTDFKDLHYKLDQSQILPTANWYIKPNQYQDIIDRANQLNIYMKSVLEKRENMSKSMFHSFFSDKNLDKNIGNKSNVICVTEKENLSNSLSIQSPKTSTISSIDEDDHIKLIKNEISQLMNDSIRNIFILYEINYYLGNKKRYFILSEHFLYKFRYDKLRKTFVLRFFLPISNIFKVEKSIVNNTDYFKGKEVLIIYFYKEESVEKIVLVSINQDLIYNINGIFSILRTALNNKTEFIISESYDFDTGYGLSENLMNHNYSKQVRNVVSYNMIYIWGYLNNY